MSIYVLIAIDEDYRVRECVAVSDSKTARDVYAALRETWDGDKVAMLSRAVDDIPDNLVGALMRHGVDAEAEAVYESAEPNHEMAGRVIARLDELEASGKS